MVEQGGRQVNQAGEPCQRDPANKNNSTGRLHANFVALAKNLTERKGLRARKNQGSLTPTSAIFQRLRCGTVG